MPKRLSSTAYVFWLAFCICKQQFGEPRIIQKALPQHVASKQSVKSHYQCPRRQICRRLEARRGSGEVGFVPEHCTTSVQFLSRKTEKWHKALFEHCHRVGRSDNVNLLIIGLNRGIFRSKPAESKK